MSARLRNNGQQKGTTIAGDKPRPAAGDDRCAMQPAFLEEAIVEAWMGLSELADRDLLAQWARRRSTAASGRPPGLLEATGFSLGRSGRQVVANDEQLAVRCGEWWKGRIRSLGHPPMELATAVLCSADDPSQWSRAAWQLLQAWQRSASRVRRSPARPTMHAAKARFTRRSSPFSSLETTGRNFAAALRSRLPCPLEVLLAASVAIDAAVVLSPWTLWQLSRVLLQWLLLQPRLPAVDTRPARRLQSASCGSDRPVEHDGDDTRTVESHLLARGELALLAAALFDENASLTPALRRAIKVLRGGLSVLVSRDGVPLAGTLPTLTRWAAPLVRATAWAKWLSVDLWDSQTADRFRKFVRATASLCLPDGQVALTSSPAHRTLSLLQTAAQLAQLPPASSARRYLTSLATDAGGLARRAGNGQKPRVRERAGDSVVKQRTSHQSWPAVQCDHAQLACLRDAWSDEASTVVLAYDRPAPRLQLWAGGRYLIEGDWGLSLRVDDRPVDLPTRWNCVCWHSDEDADYLELQAEVGHVVLERQVLLAREVGLLLLADAIKLPQCSRLEYASSLPLADDLSVVSSSETREQTLVRKRVRVARVFPLLLPDLWTESVSGTCQRVDGQLTIARTTECHRLYAPVVVDWDQRHRNKSVEWRPLTVSQDGRAVSPSTAAAFRLRVGDYQLVVYRSLQHDRSARAFLGHQTRYETVVGQFDSDGDLLPLLMVE